ncbi:MAG: phosphate/phosphite/phosphonate ABC transporter substrate-binding protein, partial [Gammaproteobacteria bacterium]|nr:phosphate/phosphite/phosphonate ABC transporter substrate-binding protein [Gammaproteobacteria bacterium]
MTNYISTYTRLIGLMFVICFSGNALAEDCYRGTLDKQYCDRNRDQVADLPLDPKDWVNPDTIIFSYTPVEDPAIYAKVWDGFIKHMSEVTGKKVV